MHATDWLPTVLELTNIHTTFPFPLDGVSHAASWFVDPESSIATPRDYMLYNYYYDVTDNGFNKWTNGSFAIRNSQYKLMHTYDSTAYGAWWNGDEELDNDDTLAEASCSQSLASTGEFTYYLFDLQADPYETTNLYHEDDTAYHAAKIDLYAALDDLEANSRGITVDVETRNKITPVVWKNHGDYIVPWVDRADLDDHSGTFPEDCYVEKTSEPTLSPAYTPSPTTLAPTPTTEYVIEPTMEPSTASPSTRSPTTSKPTIAPTGGGGDTPTWFTPTTPAVPTIGVPTIGMPTLIIAPSLINEPTCEGCPTTLPIVLDGPTWAPSVGSPSSPTIAVPTITVPTAPTW